MHISLSDKENSFGNTDSLAVATGKHLSIHHFGFLLKLSIDQDLHLSIKKIMLELVEILVELVELYEKEHFPPNFLLLFPFNPC